MAQPSSPEPGSVSRTPTWVVAAVCCGIVAISLAAERFLHYLGKFLKKKGQEALYSAVLKVKEELMLLGFISFLLSGFQGFISHICIPEGISSQMLPCKQESNSTAQEAAYGLGVYTGHMNKRRLSAEDSYPNFCTRKGEVPLLSLEALHHLHIFVFVLAGVHVVFCASTVILGGVKIRQWKHWEEKIRHKIEEQEKLVEREQGRNATPIDVLHPQHHEGFIKEHAEGSYMRLAVVSWTMAFFKQFGASVSESDYKALRARFILTHYPKYPKYNFYNYMIRALEYDFKRVVGISWYLWLFVIVFLLLNINGWHTYFWLSFLPLTLLLIVGAKLEHIITRLAQEAEQTRSYESGKTPRLGPSDELFWFGKPQVVLHLIHFILFQNSFEIAFFFWILATYGFKSCMMEKTGYLIPRLVIGLIIQVLCSYSTLPLFAIVTQMGQAYRLETLGERLHTSIHGWMTGAKKKKGRPKPGQSDSEVETHRKAAECSEAPCNVRELSDLEEIVTSPI